MLTTITVTTLTTTTLPYTPHSSHATQAPQQLGSEQLWPADVTYVGAGVQEAIAVSSALHGGQVAITQPVWGQLQGKVQSNQQVCSMYGCVEVLLWVCCGFVVGSLGICCVFMQHLGGGVLNVC